MAKIIERDNGFAVEGDMNFASAGALSRLKLPIASGQRVDVDLSAVDQVDNAGLALMLGWIRRASEMDAALKFNDIPERLKSLSQVAGVGALLDDKQ